jgi:hypothetical protein
MSKTKKMFFWEMEDRKYNRSCMGADTRSRGKDLQRECGRLSMVEIVCTHV